MGLAVVAVLAAASCGKVQFVASPFTPVDLELAYSPVEDLTRLRWAIVDPTRIRLEIGSSTGNFAPLDLPGAVYPSGSWACADRTCYQLVVRGRLPSSTRLRARHDNLGFFPAVAPKVLDDVLDPVRLTATLPPGNDILRVQIVDWLAQAPDLERRFHLTVWPEPTLACEPSPERADGLAELSSQLSLPFPAPFTDDGRYCVRVRPVPADEGPRAAFLTTLITFPDVLRGEKIYKPKVETAPVVWRLLLDLQIDDSTRCDSVTQTLASTFTTAMSGAMAPSHRLDTVEISPGCDQKAAGTNRFFDATTMADETKTYLASSYPNRFHKPILIYVNNLDARLPMSLENSFGTYLASFGSPEARPFQLAMSNGLGFGAQMWDFKLQYVAFEDPQFATTIQAFASATLPFKTQLHDNLVPVPLIDDAAVVLASDGALWKVCQASPAIVRTTGTTPIDPKLLTPTLLAARPPGFLVSLKAKVLMPGPQFMSDTVLVRYEICRRWCNHAFRDEGGADHTSWMTATQCVRNTTP